MSALFEYDLEQCSRLGGLVAGMDEAGRGPLAGPVVCAAVVLPMDFEIVGIDDSKKLTPRRRSELYEEIAARALYMEVCAVSEREIDRINILQATRQGMQSCSQALSALSEVKCLLSDALHIQSTIPVSAIIRGDATSYSIAAASIVAKVTRDRMMERQDALYPEYGFARHKGYGTAMHINALKTHGPCPIHRKSFIGKLI